MTTATASHTTNYVTTDTDYRAWGSAWSAALTAIGLIQTADTGQVNWTTVTIPALNTSTGAPYEVWRFDDALQATAPVFVKFNYARNATGNIRVVVTVGTGSNGSGTITGALVLNAVYFFGDNTNSANGAPASTTYCSYGTGYLTIISGSGNPCMGALVIERTEDSTGTATAEGIFVSMGSSSASTTNATGALAIYSPSPAVAYGLVATRGSMTPTGFTTSVFGADIMLLPRWYMVSNSVRASYNTAVYTANAVATATVFTVSLAAGVPVRSYIAAGPAFGATYTGVAMQVAARYE